MVQNFRKKPVVIEALQWTGKNLDEVKEFASGTAGAFYTKFGYLYINTLEGTMNVGLNDWIIKGIHGEFYPCKPDIFKQTYELVEVGK